jgi:hypothetical protein
MKDYRIIDLEFSDDFLDEVPQVSLEYLLAKLDYIGTQLENDYTEERSS